jgi:hypothetical protein
MQVNVLVLMEGAPFFNCVAGDIQIRSRARSGIMDESKQILIESRNPMRRFNPALKGEVERLILNVTMRLICVPNVDHAIRVFIGRGHLHLAQ